jgi:acyl-CoA reductase-like NAD-dependent aldehyde dehydrogenase
MNEKEIVSINPATREELGRTAVATKKEIHAAVEAAWGAFNAWKDLTMEKRGQFINKLATELESHTESMARLITLEMGKPIKDSSAEVTKTVRFLRFFAEHTAEYMRPSPIKYADPKDAKIVYEPIGVVAAIKPWNLPLQTPIWAIAPALMTGCTVILKPSENTLLVAKELNSIAEKCKLPKGVLSVVPGGKETGRLLLKEKIDMVSFTGSVAAGRSVASAVADRFIKTSLELGGKDAMLVFPDCDIDFAAKAAVYGSTTNCGQFCSEIQRVYAHESIYDPLVKKIVALTKKIRVGNGLDPKTDMGPVVNKPQFDKVINQLNDAVDKGAKALTGGGPYKTGELSKGLFIEPTVLVNVDHGMDIMKVETFGPIVRVMPFKDVDEGVGLANDSPYGLGASIITQDKKLAESVASRIDVGMVWVNEPLISMPSCPWISRKDSGLGSELGELGIHEFLKPKLVSMQFEDNKNRAWWYPVE